MKWYKSQPQTVHHVVTAYAIKEKQGYWLSHDNYRSLVWQKFLDGWYYSIWLVDGDIHPEHELNEEYGFCRYLKDAKREVEIFITKDIIKRNPQIHEYLLHGESPEQPAQL